MSDKPGATHASDPRRNPWDALCGDSTPMRVCTTSMADVTCHACLSSESKEALAAAVFADPCVITLKLKTSLLGEHRREALADIETALRIFYARGEGFSPSFVVGELLEAAAQARAEYRKESE